MGRPKLPPGRKRKQWRVWLTPEQSDRLIAEYGSVEKGVKALIDGQVSPRPVVRETTVVGATATAPDRVKAMSNVVAHSVVNPDYNCRPHRTGQEPTEPDPACRKCRIFFQLDG